MLQRGSRPPRGEIDEAAIGLLARHGGQILAAARHFAATPEDAEDAYQRGLEILLTKAPTTSEDELVPWLRTVVKHEAFALRRQRERHTPVMGDGELAERGTGHTATHEQAERYERLRQGAEALQQLKPQEIRCLVLKGQGLSYREICEATGFSYTKVNRCLTEGREALSVRLAGIRGGIECARLTPLLSLLADGEASASEVAALRPHLRTCLACRARLKEFREAPAQVAALMPPAALLTGPEGGGALRGMLESALGGVQQKVEGLVGASQQKAAALGERAHAAAELAAGQKLAAVAASAAALAGGGTAVEQLADRPAPPAAPAHRAESSPVEDETAVEPAPPTPIAGQQPVATEPAPAPAPEQPPPPPPSDPANEFAPNASAPAVAAAPAPTPAPAPAQPAAGGFRSDTGGAAGGGGAREFAP